MIRLYSTTLADLLDSLGYKWKIRTNEESFIYSKISYNLFGFMRIMGKVYGCRILVREIPELFQKHIHRFFSHQNLTRNKKIFLVRVNEGFYNSS